MSKTAEIEKIDKAAVILSLIGAGIYTLVALHQTGVIKELPDPPGFNSNKTMLDETAFPYGIPDGFLATGSMLSNVPLAMASGNKKVAQIAAVKSCTEAAIAAWFLKQMRYKVHTWCIYCIAAGGIYFNLAGLSLKRLRAMN